jgi:hypothetical protein
MPNLITDFMPHGPLREKVLALGMTTLEQLQAAGAVAGPELRDFLETDVDQLLASIPTAMEAIPQAALDAILSAEYSLGIDLDAIPRLAVAPVFTVAAAPGASINHVAEMPPIRSQGSRGTCVSFSSLAAVEHFLGRHGAMQDLAEQFLYWNCKANDGIPNLPGTYLGVAYPLLKRDGCCLEADWNYNATPVTGNEGQGPPPPGTQLKALSFRIPSVRTIAPTSVADYRNELMAGRVVSFSVPVFNSWYRSTAVAFSGDITLPIPGEVRTGGHAMCIVGCMDQPDQPQIGGGRFILRNSWGKVWGINSPNGAGYGTIPYGYIARFAAEAYSIG